MNMFCQIRTAVARRRPAFPTAFTPSVLLLIVLQIIHFARRVIVFEGHVDIWELLLGCLPNRVPLAFFAPGPDRVGV